MLFGCDEEIPQQLARFSLLQWQMIPVDHRLHKVLVDDFAVSLPRLPVVCDEDVIAACDKVVRHVGVWAVGVDGGFLVDQGFYGGARGEDDGGPRAEFEGEDAAVGLGLLEG